MEMWEQKLFDELIIIVFRMLKVLFMNNVFFWIFFFIKLRGKFVKFKGGGEG